MSTVRWGLLSTANINRRLIPVIRESQRGELVAVASRSKEKAGAYAAEWGIEKAFGSYDEMLASGEVDAVYISLPNHLHAEWTIKALEHGVHVLCEKPFALSLEEVDAMIEASQRSGKVLAEAFMYRHHPQTKMVGEWVHTGRLGEILNVRGVFTFVVRSRDDIRLAADMGGGALWDIGVYPMSFAQFVYGGPPRRVFGEQVVGDSGVDEVFVGQMHYEGQQFAQIWCSFRAPFQTFVEVVGTEGRLTLTRPFTGVEESQLRFHPASGDEPELIAVPEKSLYLGEVEDMHAAILDGADSYLSLQETRDHVRTVLALYESAQKQEVVEL
jgi:predicted dehydrogenase